MFLLTQTFLFARLSSTTLWVNVSLAGCWKTPKKCFTLLSNLSLRRLDFKWSRRTYSIRFIECQNSASVYFTEIQCPRFIASSALRVKNCIDTFVTRVVTLARWSKRHSILQAATRRDLVIIYREVVLLRGL